MQRQSQDFGIEIPKFDFNLTDVSKIPAPSSDIDLVSIKNLTPPVKVWNGYIPPVNNQMDKPTRARGIGSSLPKSMQSRCDPKQRIARRRSFGGSAEGDKAVIKGLNWLQTMQDADGSTGYEGSRF